MDDVKAVIEQATDTMGAPPETPAKALKPEVKKVGQAAKKVARKVGPKKKVAKKAKKLAKKSAKKAAKKAPKKAKAAKKEGKESETLRSNEIRMKVRSSLLSSRISAPRALSPCERLSLQGCLRRRPGQA